MPRFNSINFYQYWLKKQNFAKILLNFAKKTQNFRAQGAALLDPRSRRPPLQISGYSPAYTDMQKKDWFKIRVGKLWENKTFSNIALMVFSFQIALKILM